MAYSKYVPESRTVLFILTTDNKKAISFTFSVQCCYCRDVDWKPKITSVTNGGKPKWWRWIRREMKSLFISLVKNNTFNVTLDLTFHI